jgi:thiosulfate dehydrogenase
VKAFLVGLIFGLIIIPVGVYEYFSSGSAPVAAGAEPMPFEKMLASKALHARMAKEVPKSVPIQWDEANLTAGAHVYVQQCAVCHGLPGQELSAAAKGMFPRPPKLTEGTGVTDDPPQESYWKIAGGIRMSGMPGFKGSLSDAELWQVSLFVANADKLPDTAKQVLSRALTGPSAPPQSATPTKTPKH